MNQHIPPHFPNLPCCPQHWSIWRLAGAGRGLKEGKEQGGKHHWEVKKLHCALVRINRIYSLQRHHVLRYLWRLQNGSNIITPLGKWLKNSIRRASLVAQWLRICLPMQGTRVRALVWEDPTCHGATRPVSHNYWACASGACAPQQERPRQWEARAPRWRVAAGSPQLEKALAQKRRPNTAINKLINK